MIACHVKAMIETRILPTPIEAAFTVRLDKIRARVALKLADKIQQTDVALPQMTGSGAEAVDAVATAYRWFHDISGIGPTIGFEATGRQARSCADVLVGPFRARRGLSKDELGLLTSSLESLRIAALHETHSTETN
jgi:hypothetical protein